MKKILLTVFILLCVKLNCFAQSGITFLYINGSNNNDKKMERWYEKGVKKLHPHMKQAFEKNAEAKKYFLKNGEFKINETPNIFFWGYRSHDDLNFVERNLSLSKGFSPWLAYQIRSALTHYLHDAIWVQKYHNMAPVLDDLHNSVTAESKKGNKTVLFGYSAGSFVTYEYLLTRLPYINVLNFLKDADITKEQLDFVKQNPMNNTCMDAIGQELAIFSVSGHIIPILNTPSFKKNYLNLNEVTKDVCIQNNSVKGVVNFASPLVLFYSDLSDPNFQLTYYNRLLFKYIIENDMFWLTVNYRSDPLGFPGGKNLSIEEMEDITNIDIEPHAGFMYDQSDTWSRNSALATHTSYWATRKIFSRAVVNAYVKGYKHQYDDSCKKTKTKKHSKKLNIKP